MKRDGYVIHWFLFVIWKVFAEILKFGMDGTCIVFTSLIVSLFVFGFVSLCLFVFFFLEKI